MIKMIYMLKRHPSLTREAFIKRYEEGHAVLAAPYLAGATRYVRRYLEPQPMIFTGEIIEPDHDVITELWFDDQAAMDATMAKLSAPDVAPMIIADEETIFDRSKHLAFKVDERDEVKGG
jgi:EthD domain